MLINDNPKNEDIEKPDEEEKTSPTEMVMRPEVTSNPAYNEMSIKPDKEDKNEE